MSAVRERDLHAQLAGSRNRGVLIGTLFQAYSSPDLSRTRLSETGKSTTNDGDRP